jgi:hypothetical protein
MKLANFNVDGLSEIGLAEGTRYVSLTRALSHCPVSMVEMIAQWEIVRPAIGELHLALRGRVNPGSCSARHRLQSTGAS